MNLPLVDRIDPEPAPGTHGATGADRHDLRRRRPWIILAVAAATVAVAAGAIIADRSNDGSGDPQTDAGPPLVLSLGEGDALASCMPFDIEILRQMPVAFAGTATAVDGETVSLTVDRWYRGGDSGTVELHAPAGMNALIAGFDVAVGESYLITATDGSVNYCGFSGPASAELTAAFDAAFAR